VKLRETSIVDLQKKIAENELRLKTQQVGYSTQKGAISNRKRSLPHQKVSGQRQADTGGLTEAVMQAGKGGQADKGGPLVRKVPTLYSHPFPLSAIPSDIV
jgi:hypothetical protein